MSTELEALRELVLRCDKYESADTRADRIEHAEMCLALDRAKKLLNTYKPLKDLGKETNEINRANGWHIPNSKDWTDSEYIMPTFLMLIVSEVSEAFEAFRKNNEVNFVEEMADIFIRVVNLADGLGIDLDTAVKEKLEKNRMRSHKHGGKRV